MSPRYVLGPEDDGPECEDGHFHHDCTCDEEARAYHESEAQAQADAYFEREWGRQ